MTSTNRARATRWRVPQLAAALAAVLCVPGALADWVPIGGTAHTYEYVDLASLRVSGDLRRVWVLDDLGEPDQEGDRSYRSLLEFNCSTQHYRSLQSIFYAGAMATGNMTGRTDQPSAWRTVAADSLSASVMRAVCRVS